MKPTHITFTGIDARTDLKRADKLARKYPIEWGLLFSTRNGDCRYTSNQVTEEVLRISGRKAAHLCGKYYRDLVHSSQFRSLPHDIDKFDTVQLNGFNNKYWANQLSEYLEEPVILQTQCRVIPKCEFKNVSYLYDPSGGRGISIDYVPELIEGAKIGYAGGLGPGKVKLLLSKIEGEGEFWIDMETGVRTNGWFDLNKVEKVCEQVYG